MLTVREPLEDGEVVATPPHSTAEALGSAGGTDSEHSSLVLSDSSILANTPDSGPGFPLCNCEWEPSASWVAMVGEEQTQELRYFLLWTITC